MSWKSEVITLLPCFTPPLTLQLPSQFTSTCISSTRQDLRVSRRRLQIIGCAPANNAASNEAAPPVAANGTPPPPRPSSSVSELHPSWTVYYNDEACVVCQGRGHSRCLFCFGEGSIVIGAQAERDTIPCPQCHGTCIEICGRCEGTGKRPLTRYDPKTKTEVRNITNRELRQPKQKPPKVEENEELATVQQ